MSARYRDRRHAGAMLALSLAHHAGRSDVVVLALPPGGVPVGYEVAERLGAPLDVLMLRKLGAPEHPELAVGAITSGSVPVLSEQVIASLGVSREALRDVVALEALELARQEEALRAGAPAVDVGDRIAILVDDGLAPGATMRAAVHGLRLRRPARLVVALPIAAWSTCHELTHEVDELVCAANPAPFTSLGLWYEDFAQPTEQEVRGLLQMAAFDTERRVAQPPAALVRARSRSAAA